MDANAMKEQLKELNETLNSILPKILSEEYSELHDSYEWIKKLYDRNVVKGKHNRALIVANAYLILAHKSGTPPTDTVRQESYILGWAIEVLHASALIFDDIIDGSVTRRGQNCWYKEVGLRAINDGVLLEQHCYAILRLFFRQKPYYTKLIDVLHQVTELTCYGQLLENIEMGTNKEKFQKFTKSRLDAIYKFKTSLYSFVIPVKMAMIANSCDSDNELQESEAVLLKLGNLFQMQDDFLDCFGDPTVTGKIGTDIEDGKCCWPIVTALELCDENQLKVLETNYSLKCEANVSAVKQVYKELDLIRVFEVRSTQVYDNICADIQNMKLNKSLCPEIYKYILGIIYRRQK